MKNTVKFIGYYGGDTTIACSAWTSTDRELSDNKKARIGKMLDMLWSDEHETPFEKGIIHFLVDTDIASHIHLLKHRMSSLNAESARYKELKEDKYYIPEDWIGIDTHIDYRIDCGQFTATSIWGSWADALEEYTKLGNLLYHQCVKDIEPVLGRKRAKESARFFKTYNSQIQADVMFNMRSFANFVKLRNSEHAQLEIREIAQQMLSLVTNIDGDPFKETLATFEKRWSKERNVNALHLKIKDLEKQLEGYRKND
ncbi:FAD-dependent thymidylate synthase [bacterium]|nr:FAD-dependent thymidylate synthase [bacterium]